MGHTGGVWCSEFDGATVVSGSTDRTLRVNLYIIITAIIISPGSSTCTVSISYDMVASAVRHIWHCACI